MNLSHATLLILLLLAAVFMPGFTSIAHAQTTDPVPVTEPVPVAEPAPIAEPTPVAEPTPTPAPAAAVLIAAPARSEVLAEHLEDLLAHALAGRLDAPVVTTRHLLATSGFHSRAGLTECALNDVCRDGLARGGHLPRILVAQLDPRPTEFLLDLQLYADGRRLDHLPLRVDLAGGDAAVDAAVEDAAAKLALLPPAPAPPVAVAPEVKPPPPATRPSDLSALGLTGLGAIVVGASTLGAAGYFRLQYDRHLNDLERLTRTPQPPGQRAYIASLQSDLNDDAAASNLLVGLGLGSLAVGAALFVWDIWPDDAPSTTSWTLTPSADGARLDLGVAF